MRRFRNSVNSRLYRWLLSNQRCSKLWRGEYWQEQDGFRVIRCRECRRFDAKNSACTVPFGTPVRKCATAAMEANLHSLSGKQVLEIGCGGYSLTRLLVTRAGGTWSGIEPMMPRNAPARLGQGGYGHVADMPFDDATFDLVTGIQTLEHLDEPLPDPELEVGYEKSLAEIHRVLKPGGKIYFDAPIHLHGHEMFICGDVARIRAMFENPMWRDVIIEKWREDYAPLARYPTPPGDQKIWESAVTSYPESMLDKIRNEASVWLITVKAIRA